MKSGCRQLNEADIVIFNHDITAAQQRNLERKLNCRVIDRSALILDIFALRAKSHEGKLAGRAGPVAALSTRLVRGWTHLERQKGGIGLRGPVRSSSKPTVVCLASGSSCSSPARPSSGSVPCGGGPGSAAKCSPFRWSATPTRASPRCSMR
jgi:hypothetical protein